MYMTSNENQKEFVREDKSAIDSKDFMIGALIGRMLGAAAALLLAPKSGRELRSDINEGAKYITDKTEKIRQTAVEKGSEFAEVAKTKTSSLSEKVSKQSANIIENVKTDDLSLIALEDMWFRMNYKDLPKEQKNAEDVQWIKKKIQKKMQQLGSIDYIVNTPLNKEQLHIETNTANDLSNNQ